MPAFLKLSSSLRTKEKRDRRFRVDYIQPKEYLFGNLEYGYEATQGVSDQKILRRKQVLICQNH